MYITKEQLAEGMSADTELAAIDVSSYRSFSCHIKLLNGNAADIDVTLQYSNDKETWVDVTGTIKNIAGTEDSQLYDVVQTAVSYVRLKFVVNSGDGDIDVDWILKE